MSKTKKYWHTEVGRNFRMTNIQAAIGCGQLKNYDLICEKEINLYQYYYGDYFSLHLGNTDIMIKNNKNETHTIKYLGLKDPLTGKRGDLFVLFRVNLDKHNLQSEEDKKLMDVLFN